MRGTDIRYTPCDRSTGDGRSTTVAGLAGQRGRGCAALPGGEASADYLRHLVFIHARQALREAFASA